VSLIESGEKGGPGRKAAAGLEKNWRDFGPMRGNIVMGCAGSSTQPDQLKRGEKGKTPPHVFPISDEGGEVWILGSIAVSPSNPDVGR